MEAASSESRPLLGSSKKNKRKKGMRPQFEELMDPSSSKGNEELNRDGPKNYGLFDDRPPPYSVENDSPSAPPLPELSINPLTLGAPATSKASSNSPGPGQASMMTDFSLAKFGLNDLTSNLIASSSTK